MNEKPINSKPLNPNSESKPKLKGLKNLLLLLQSMITPGFGGSKSGTKQSDGSGRLCIALSIKQLQVWQFLQAACYDDYSGIPDWNVIMSEYYIAKKDKNALEYIRIVTQMKAIEFSALMLDWRCNMLSEAYSPELAEVLRSEYPMCQFTEATYQQDIKFLGNLERNNKVEHDDLSKQLEALSNPANGKELTSDEKYDGFMNLIYDINKFMQYGAITLQSTVYEFACATHKLEKYIESLQQK